jgi:hypothetical protein
MFGEIISVVTSAVTSVVTTASQQVGWLGLGVLSALGIGLGVPTGSLYLFPYVVKVSSQSETLLQAFFQTLPAALSWGVGTCIGEIPPFYLGKRCSQHFINVKVRDLVQRRGRVFIFFMACYPNMLFDCVGLASGSLGLSLDFFLLPTMIGKAFVKAPLQNLVMCSVGFYGTDVARRYLPQCVFDTTSIAGSYAHHLCLLSTVVSCFLYLKFLKK